MCVCVKDFADGYVIHGDSTSQSVIDAVLTLVGGPIGLIIADPPYGNIVDEKWDKTTSATDHAEWMLSWTNSFADLLVPGGAFYVWGGVGTVGHRPLYRYLAEVESRTSFQIANHITWAKKRAYGVQHNYLFTREEYVYLIKGDIKKPHTFNVPLLREKRGYAGYNKKYPAKSEFKRRTNVWTDITELLRNKIHPTQKPLDVIKIPIETHTKLHDWVFDPFAGSGVTALAARALNRRFVIVEKDDAYFQQIIDIL